MKPACVIVGAGPGLGLAIARRFAKGGCSLALVGRSPENLARLTDELQRDGFPACGFPADAGNEAQLSAALDQIIGWAGEIAVLIYNAAQLNADDVCALTPAAMRQAMEINLEGAITSVNRLLPVMRRQGGGTILLTGGGLALEPYPDWATLGAGKAALRSYGLSLHKALVSENIHVAVIAVCGIVEPGGLFAPDLIAEEYWKLHMAEGADRRRELVYLPQGADPFYNDTQGRHRASSRPIVPD